MAIVEKRIKINLEKGSAPGVEHIENAIRRAGLEPIRWAIVEKTRDDEDDRMGALVILANGVSTQC